MCKNCNENCIGMYLLHPAEMHKVELLKAKHIGAEFALIESPSSGEVFLCFKELYVIINPVVE